MYSRNKTTPKPTSFKPINEGYMVKSVFSGYNDPIYEKKY